jgi:hypothetical protein
MLMRQLPGEPSKPVAKTGPCSLSFLMFQREGQKKGGKMQGDVKLFCGCKVVCVNDKFPRQILEWTTNLPREGDVYTIRRIERGHCLYTRQRALGLSLHELPSIQDRLGFRADRFLPLFNVEREAVAAVLPLIRKMGYAAMKSAVEKAKSGTLSSSQTSHVEIDVPITLG